MTILNIAEAVLYVDDLAEATGFYERVLALPLTQAFADASFLQTGPDSTLILFDRQKLASRISVIPGHGSRGSGHVAFAIAAGEMDEWRERLIGAGVEIEHEQDWPAGTHSIYFRDPAGNSLELIDNRHYPLAWQRIASSE